MSSPTSAIQMVSSFEELLNTPYYGNVNAFGYARELEGDFEEVAQKIQLQDDITNVSVEQLQSLNLSAAGNLARETILNDFKTLSDFGAQPNLNLIKQYERDTTFDFISTDVYSFHVDRAPIPTHTFLCTYFGATSDILLNQDAEQMIHIPEIRKQLLELHHSPKSTFEAFLEEYFFDLHYRPKAGAKPINMQLGHLWKLAVDNPLQAVPPCIHRAPKENKGELRLMMIC